MKEIIIEVPDRFGQELKPEKVNSEIKGELVRCKDCEYSYTEGFVHPHLICEKHPELGSVADDWFCADGWKA